MAERKATNKYYPPDWDPSKGSLNAFQGSHPLRDRARKLDAGILIIRFEMPFNIWCTSCDGHIGCGVRFNAEKKRTGQYLSTPIFSFGMKCPSCKARIVMRTDPEHATYVVVEGGKRKTEQYEAESAQVQRRKTDEEAEMLVKNPLFKLEHDVHDKRRAQDIQASLERLQTLQDEHFKDDYSRSRALRASFRADKKRRVEERGKERDLVQRLNLGVPLAAEHPEDVQRAQSVKFQHQQLPKTSLVALSRKLKSKSSK